MSATTHTAACDDYRFAFHAATGGDAPCTCAADQWLREWVEDFESLPPKQQAEFREITVELMQWRAAR